MKLRELSLPAREAALDNYADSKEPDWDWYVDSLLDDGVLYTHAKEKGICAESCDIGFDWHHGRKTFDRVMPRGTFGFMGYLIEVETDWDDVTLEHIGIFRGRTEDGDDITLPEVVVREFGPLYDELCREMLQEADGYLFGDFEPKLLEEDISNNGIEFTEDGSIIEP